jgi:malate dehydrogenase
MVGELLQPSGTPLSVCARLEGEYGIDDVYMCVPALLGAQGVEKIVELDLTADERAALQNSAQAIKTQLAALT